MTKWRGVILSILGVLLIIQLAVHVSALSYRSVDEMTERRFLEELVVKGPLSKWVSFKSSITSEDVKQISDLKHRRANPDAPLIPVMIIPPLTGSVLVATLKDFKSQYSYCPSNWDSPFYLWIDYNINFFLYANCWFEHMTLQFDPATNISSNTSGVFVDIIDYGGVGGVEYMGQNQTLGLWNDTVIMLQALGYETGKNLRAAPFDWRKGPIEYMQEDFPRLKKLVEETYEMNNNTPIAFISLSMGGPYFLSFLNNAVTQEWKDKYVHSYYSLDGAFGGAVESILSVTDPYFLAEVINPLLEPFTLQFQKMMRSFPSFTWMFPIPQFLGNDTNLAVTSGKYGSFNINQWPELLQASSIPDAAQSLNYMIEQNLTRFQAPGVKMYCIFGVGLDTLERVEFQGGFDSPYKHYYADGDLTVLRPGLDICSYFQGQQEKPLISLPVEGMEHGTSVHNKEVLNYFVRTLLASEP